MSGVHATDIDANIDEDENEYVWIVSHNERPWLGYNLYSWDNLQWVENQHLIANPIQVSVDFLGRPWIVDLLGDLYSFTGVQWI